MACEAAGRLIKAEHYVYSPICHSHPIATHCDLPKEYEYWKDLDREFIDWCEAMVVLKLDGWDKSVGIKDEISYARMISCPVHYWEPGTPAPV